MKFTGIPCGLILFALPLFAQQYTNTSIIRSGPPLNPSPALTVSIGQPSSIAVNASGNVYFTDDQCVYRVGQDGALNRVAGNGITGFSGDGGPAIDAQLNNPSALAFDATGNLFVSDFGNARIRKISVNGTIATVAGNGIAGFSGDNGPAAAARLGGVYGVAVDGDGNLFLADMVSSRIREVATNGIITTIAGTGNVSATGNGGPALAAAIGRPYGIAFDQQGNLFFSDQFNKLVRKISTAGTITAVAGATLYSSFSKPSGIAIDASDNLFITDGDFTTGDARVWEMSPNSFPVSVAGGGGANATGDGSPATTASLETPVGVAIDKSGNMSIADFGAEIVRQVSAAGIITTIAGNGTYSFSGDGGPASAAQAYLSGGIALDQSGNLYFSDNQRIRKIDTNGVVTTFAGGAAAPPPSLGDGGPATAANLWTPTGIAFDHAGNLFIADSLNNRVRKVSTDGTITTVAGNAGSPLNNPQGVAVDESGNLFIAADGDDCIWEVTPDGTITRVAGTGTFGFGGDNGPAIDAQLNSPTGVTVDAQGNLYILDAFNDRIRKVSPDGIITTLAGNGTTGYSGDRGPAIDAELYLAYNQPGQIAVDAGGNVIIADRNNVRVRKVSPDGIITTIAGGVAGEPVDGMLADRIFPPAGVFLDGAGDLFLSSGGIEELKPTVSQPVAIDAVTDAATEIAESISPGKIVAIYGVGLGPTQAVTAAPTAGTFGTQLAGTTVSFNGIPAPVYYASATQVNAIVPYSTSGPSADIIVSTPVGVSLAFSVPVAASSPGLFSYNASGAGQVAAINAVDGTLNNAANPAKIGSYISLYATGEGQTNPAGVDGKLATLPMPAPLLPVTATVDGIPATVQYRGGVYGEVAGLMQVNIQIPPGVTPGGYVPVILTVGTASTVDGAAWISVTN